MEPHLIAGGSYSPFLLPHRHPDLALDVFHEGQALPGLFQPSPIIRIMPLGPGKPAA